MITQQLLHKLHSEGARQPNSFREEIFVVVKGIRISIVRVHNTEGTIELHTEEIDENSN